MYSPCYRAPPNRPPIEAKRFRFDPRFDSRDSRGCHHRVVDHTDREGLALRMRTLTKATVVEKRRIGGASSLWIAHDIDSDDLVAVEGVHQRHPGPATRRHGEPALAALDLSIATVIVWNRLNVATRQEADAWTGCLESPADMTQGGVATPPCLHDRQMACLAAASAATAVTFVAAVTVR